MNAAAYAPLRPARRHHGDRNDADAILGATDELMREILERNELAAEDLVSCIFTLTDDLDAEFPAVAARKMGLSACRCCAPARCRCRARCRA